MDEQQFAEDVQAAMTAIVQAYEVMEAAERIYFARGWNSGGANEITDADLTAAGFQFDAATLGASITVAQQVGLLLTNQATTPGNYISTLDKMRAKL
jgi:hypothetical protein